MDHTASSTIIPSDVELIDAVSRGDEQALALLYDRHGALLYSFSLQMSGDRQLAEEAVQNAFLSVWRSADTFDVGRSSLTTWLVAILKNRTRDLLRKRGREPLSQTIDWNLAAAPASDPSIDTEERLRADEVRRALHELPQEQRQVIHLTYFLGFSHREASERLSIPLGTVKSRIRLALERLTHLL